MKPARPAGSVAAMRAVLDAASQAILASVAGQIILANRGAESMFGYCRRELIGLPVESLIQPRTKRVRGSARRGIPGQPVEFVGLRKDGSEFPVELNQCAVAVKDRRLSVSFVSDVTHHKESQEMLLQGHTALRRLTAQLLDMEKNASKQLAGELHDALSQKLAVLGMEVSSLSQALPPARDALVGHLRGLASQIGNLADDVHGLSRRLHPAILDDLGLDAALREECHAFSQRSGIPTKYRSDHAPTEFPEEVSLCLYRVAQESLRNIAKHAKASEVRVRLSGAKAGVRLRIEDLGDGFHLSEIRKKGGLGLASMEERVRMINGDFSIRSQPGKGTQVSVFVPLSNSRARRTQ